MVQEQVGGIGNESNSSSEPISGIEAKRNAIKFKRADSRESTEAFGDNGRTKRTRIPKEKRAEVSINDNGIEGDKEVKGKAPKLPDLEEQPKRRGRPSTKSPIYPSLVEAGSQAQFLLSAIEVAAVTTLGPTGEMSEWERGVMQAPLQRCLARIPIEMLSKGGLVFDLAFLTMGSAIYLTRITKGIKVPTFGRNKKAGVVNEDQAAPVSAPAHDVVDNIKAGDRDGLAVPVPTVIQNYMNGAI